MTALLAPADQGRRWRRALVPSMLVAPATITLLGCVVLLVAAPSLPAAVAVHWGIDGVRTGSPYAALICLPLTVAVSAVLWIALRRPADVRPSPRLRFVLGLPLWLACFLTIGLVGSTVLQAQPGAPVPGLPLAVGFALGLLAGGVAAFTAPQPPAAGAVPAVRSQPEPAAGERLAWLGRAAVRPGLMAAVLGVLGAAAVGVVVAGLATSPGVALVGLVPALLLPLVASSLSWRGRVDARGVAATGALGFPVLRVPLEDVAAADVEGVAPIGDFGGIGLRFGRRGTTAVATRGGEALVVTRKDGRRLVLTVDDAATAAGVLRALHL
jgi:hypothetical protein